MKPPVFKLGLRTGKDIGPMMKSLSGAMLLAGLLTWTAVPAFAASPAPAPVVAVPEVKTAVEPAAPRKLFGPGVTPPHDAPGRFGPGATKVAEGAGGYGVAAWRLWAMLAVLASMLGGLFYILRKYGRGTLPGGAADIMTVKAKVQLDARNSVTVLKIYEEEYVIGSGTEGVRLLARLMPIDGVEEEPPPDDEDAGERNLEHAEKEIEKDFSTRFENMIESEEIK